jgi:hypothetical protein
LSPFGSLVSLPAQNRLVLASATPHELAGNCWQPLPVATPVPYETPQYCEDPFTGGLLAMSTERTQRYTWSPASAVVTAPGCAIAPPRLRASTYPAIGFSFALDLTCDEGGGVPAMAAVDFGNGPVAIGGCTMHLDAVTLAFFALTNVHGHARFDAPIAPLPSLRGQQLHAQSAVLSPANALGIAVSNGLMLTLGD